MTIRICRELLLFNFKRVDILCPLIRHPSAIVWLVDFLKSFHCSILSVSIYYFPESDIRVKCYDYSNFSRASVVQFRASRWVMSPNRTSAWKVRSIWISRELPLFNFERLDILCPLNRTFVWNVMTIGISWVHPLFNFECLDELCPRIGHLCEKL